MNQKECPITTPQELLDWMKEHDEMKAMGQEEAALLLRYLEEQGHVLSADGSGKLVLTEAATGASTVQQHGMDDVIDLVYNRNFHMVWENSKDIVRTHDTAERDKFVEKLDGLRRDESVIERLFRQTRYPDEMKALASGLSDIFIKKMQEQGVDITPRQDSVRDSKDRGAR